MPVGLFNTSWGGAAAEAFTSRQSLEGLEAGREYVELFEQEAAAKASGAEGEYPRLRENQRPAHLYNGMIYPAAPFAQRGVIWYQGESNAGRAGGYDELMKTLIDDWRGLWDQPEAAREFPFLTVQLANFRQPRDEPGDDGWASLRDAQMTTAMTHPQTYIATAVDIGQADDIHPTNKQEVGRRLSLIALRNVYGRDDLEDQGPTLAKTHRVDGQPRQQRLHFAHADGLMTRDGEAPRGFAVRAAGDGPWVWAESAEIHGQDVLVTAPEGIEAPFDVRYGWATNPTDGPHGINVYNAAGLPAFPFEYVADE